MQDCNQFPFYYAPLPMILVLTIGRSGSSLMMQTLRQLGQNVLGPAHAEEGTHYIQGNPKGYYVEQEIWNQGICSPRFQELLTQDCTQMACKMAVRNLHAAERVATWPKIDRHIRAVFITFREPVEQASSLIQLFSKNTNDRMARFITATEFFGYYVWMANALARAMTNELSGLRTRTQLIDYKEAIINPEAYVERIIGAADLKPHPDQTKAAIANIDAKLYRHRQKQMPEELQVWSQKFGAAQTYNLQVDAGHPTNWESFAAALSQNKTVV